MTTDEKIARSEPECRTCEDWGTVVVTGADGEPHEVPCPDHVGSVRVPPYIAGAQT